MVVYVDNQTIGKDVWFDNVQVLHYNTKVMEENHYYPFGLTLSTTAMGITEQPLKYNGKELETSFELQTYEYGARQYNSQIGRWNGIDPLAAKYYGVSPFAYVANNTAKFVDPDGKRVMVYHNGKAYEYVSGVKPAAGSPEVLMKVHEASAYNMQTKTGQRVWTAVGNSEKIVNIYFKDAVLGDENTDRFRAITQGRKEGDLILGDIDWDMNSRSQVGDDCCLLGYFAPSTKLLYEMGHVSRMIKALSYGLTSPQWKTFLSNTNEKFGEVERYGTIEEKENMEENEYPYIKEINTLERKSNGDNASFTPIR